MRRILSLASAVAGIVATVIPVSAGATTASVDNFTLTVYYTEAATPVPFFSWWSVPLLIAGLFMILKKEGMLTHHLTFPWGK